MMIGTISYSAKVASSGGNFVASGMAGTAPVDTASPADANVLVTLSAKAQAMLAQRQVSDGTGEAFRAILAKARSAGAEADPQEFVQRLNPGEREVLRQVHCLADPIDPTKLSFEGAFNLLQEPGAAVDLNNNG